MIVFFSLLCSLFVSRLNRTELHCGHFSLTLCNANGTLWVGAPAAHTVEVHTELFGFGSGDFVKGSECKDVMSDVSEHGRWLLFALKSADEVVVLEKQRGVPAHLESLTFWNKVSWKEF